MSSVAAHSGPHRRARLDRLAFIVLTVLCLCWGLNQVAIKLANAGIPPVFQALLRSAAAAVLIATWARLRGVALLPRDGTILPGMLCGLLFGLEFVALYWGLDHTTAARGVVFFYTMPFFVALGAAIWLPYERLAASQLVGLAGAFAGMAFGVADSLGAPEPGALRGDLLCVLAAALWAATTLVIKTTALVRAPAERLLFYQLAFSVPVLAAAAPLFGPLRIVDPAPLVLGALAFQIVVVVGITYLTWFWLIRIYPAAPLASFTFLTPLFGVGAGALLLAEPVTPALALALALVAGGIYLVNRPPR
jgi:drug/metabolite transporter (DMT)-like permease